MNVMKNDLLAAKTKQSEKDLVQNSTIRNFLVNEYTKLKI